MRERRDGRVQWEMSQVQYRAVQNALIRVAEWIWHDLRFKDLHRSGKQFELTERAMGFAALGHAHRVPVARRRRCRQRRHASRRSRLGGLRHGPDRLLCPVCHLLLRRTLPAGLLPFWERLRLLAPAFARFLGGRRTGLRSQSPADRLKRK